MALQLNRKSNLKLYTVTGAIVVGASLLVLRTYPHLRTSLKGYFAKSRDDNDPVEVTDDDDEPLTSSVINGEAAVDIDEWSTDNLKSWLQEVRGEIRPAAPILTSRKKSILPRMLVILSLFPLLSLFRKELNITQVVIRILLWLRSLGL